MKTLAPGLAAMAAAIVLTGCETPYGTADRTGTGALLGGGIGAASGAIIGGRHAGEGALIGGAIGAVTGGLIGHSLDEQERERLRAQAPQAYAHVEQGQPLSIADVKAMAAAGISDEVIVSQIRNTHTIYKMSAADIVDLHNSGVSDKLIDFMINTASSAPYATTQPETVVVQQPPPAPRVEAVVVAPAPGYVWIPGEWQWHGRWVWYGGRWSYPPRPHTVWVRGSWYKGPRGWHHTPGHWR